MSQGEPTQKDPIDETSDESFPASDPPAWTGAHAGSPNCPERDGRWSSVTRLRAAAAPVLRRVERLVRGAGREVLARVRRRTAGTSADPMRR